MKIMYLVGIPASGKSHYAKELAKKEKAIVLSTDRIRRELFGDASKQKKTNLVYKELYKRLEILLEQGENVVIDATNIERERRMKFTHKVKKYKATLECYYFDTPYEQCISRNQKRERVVESIILEKMRKNLEFPILNEGWDHVHIVHEKSSYDITKEEFVALVESEGTYEWMFDNLVKLPFFKEMKGFNQENPFHQFLLCEHTYYVYQYVNEYYEGEDKLALQIAALFHDTGKPFCKKFKPLRNYYSYFGHEHVSSQMVCHFLSELGFEESFVTKVVNLVDLHMLINYGGEEGEREIYHLIGAEELTNLYFFREADRFAK